MSRRRLEAAIQAGRLIEQGDVVTDICERAEVYYCHRFEAVRDGVYCLQYSYDGATLIVGYGDGGIEALSSKDGRLLRELQRHRLGGMAVTCLRFCPQEHHLVYAASCEGRVTACNVNDSTATDVVTEATNEIQCLDFNLEGNRFATAGRDLSVRIYDTAVNSCVQSYTGYSYTSADQSQQAGHAQRIFALKYHPQNNNVFVTGGWDNHLKIWDSRTKDGVQRTIHGPHICGDSLDIKGSQILTGSWVARSSLQLWDYGSGEVIETIGLDHVTDRMPHHHGDGPRGEFMYSAQFAGDNLILAGGSGIMDVLVISANTCQVVSEVDVGSTIQAIDSTHGGHTFTAGGAGGKLKMVKMV